MERIIVSRHRAATDFIARHLHPEWHPPVRDAVGIRWSPLIEPGDPEYHSILDSVPVLESATADDVRGKIVYGNLPMHLAASAAEVRVIEFQGTAPRGAEYSLAEMDAAGARIVHYEVRVATGSPSVLFS